MSSGVQITGKGNPQSSKARKTRGKIMGFAMCLQFHVNKKSTPLTAAEAMWRASTMASGGRIARAIMSAASSSIWSLSGVKRNALEVRRSLAGEIRPSHRCLIEYVLGCHHFVTMTVMIPPGPRQPLPLNRFRGRRYVLPQKAYDRRLDVNRFHVVPLSASDHVNCRRACRRRMTDRPESVPR